MKKAMKKAKMNTKAMKNSAAMRKVTKKLAVNTKSAVKMASKKTSQQKPKVPARTSSKGKVGVVKVEVDHPISTGW